MPANLPYISHTPRLDKKPAICKWIIAFCFLLILPTAYAYIPLDSLVAVPPLPEFSQVNVTSDSASVTIPFTRAGNLIILHAKVDTTEGNFVLDTGAPGLVLNITYFRQYTAKAVDGDQGGITGSVSEGAQTTVQELSFNGITYSRLDADMINLGHIENKKGIRILGLLGMQLFERFQVVIDYQHNLIQLHLIHRKEPSANCLELLGDTAAYTTIPIDIEKNKIVAHAQIENKSLRFVVDYGAETNVLDSRLPGKILDHVTISQRILLSGSGDSKVEALYGSVKDMTIGDVPVATMPVVVTNLEKMCYSYNYCIDGMLGFDYLSLHKIGFNFVKHKMYIWK